MKFKPFLENWSPLILIVSAGLFFELAVIRWLAAEVRLFSYFKNLPLLAAFLGLAIGYARSRQKDLSAAFAPLLGIFVLLVLVVSRVTANQALIYPGRGETHIWYSADVSYWLALTVFIGLVSVFFMLTMFVFVPLGQAAGREMDRHPPLPAYIANLLASLLGIWLFTLVSYLQLAPLYWFVIGFLAVGGYAALRARLSPALLAGFLLILAGVFFTDSGATWSPYHRLDIEPLQQDTAGGSGAADLGYSLQVQQVFYMSAINLSEEFLSDLDGSNPALEDIAESYNIPYRFAEPGSDVLIVGSGMGNDIAAALRHAPASVDAVEIDPAIVAFGQEYHPEQPYQDPRVRVVVDDARSFFEKTEKKYDLVVFGLLDSQTLLSAMSNVRLDSFVYTTDSLEKVKELLRPGGKVALTFAYTDLPWFDERLGRILAEVFGAGEVFAYRGATGITFMTGLDAQVVAEGAVSPWAENPAYDDLKLTTDDWPYLYLQRASVPDAYWQVLIVIAAITFLVMRRSFPEVLRPKWHFWFLGAAFLLIEFKAITELALLFGTTWLVNALAITGVLLMAVLANVFMLRVLKINLHLAYLLLFLSLAISYIFPLEILNALEFAWRAAASLLLLSSPLFFAGLIFAGSLKKETRASTALASNLSGAFAGGVLEYGSIIFGIKSLYVVAIAVYAMAYFAMRGTQGEQSGG